MPLPPYALTPFTFYLFPLKIIYIKDSLGNPAGMERVLCTKANFLADKMNHSVHIITKYALPQDTFFDFSPSVKIESLSFSNPSGNLILRHYFKYKTGIQYKKRLLQRLCELKPDVVISLFGEEFSFLHTFKNLRCIIEFHYSRNYLTHLVNGLPGIRLRWLRLLYVKWEQYRQRSIALKYDKVVLLTERDRILWGSKPNLTVIPNPLSFRCERKAELKNKQVLAMGRLIAQKGFDILINAFSTIALENPGWTLLIVGEGQDEIYLNKLIVASQMSSGIKIIKPQKDVINLFLSSSIFALPSRYEGFGLVLIEAMECGVPCVAFDCECGPAEILTHNTDGLLVENGNVRKLAKALDLMIKDEARRKEMGRNACANVTRFYPESVMKDWNTVFSEC
jgi:glycosyltransferase involved in cell wall biosynthesis